MRPQPWRRHRWHQQHGGVLSCATCPSLHVWGSVGGDNSWGLLCASCSQWSWLMVTAEERREKMSAVMCCGAWQCCGTQHTREPQTACGMQLLSGCSGALGCSHHQDPPGNLSFVSPMGFSWLVPMQSPGSFSWCAAKRGCGRRMGQSRQVHGQVYSTWLSVNEIRRDQEQQTPGGRWW